MRLCWNWGFWESRRLQAWHKHPTNIGALIIGIGFLQRDPLKGSIIIIKGSKRGFYIIVGALIIRTRLFGAHHTTVIVRTPPPHKKKGTGNY